MAEGRKSMETALAIMADRQAWRQHWQPARQVWKIS